MKTILYMGITANGYIAKADGNSEFTSEEDLKGFYDHSKSAGNIIMGKNTYLEASRQGYFPFPDALNIIMTSESIENKWGNKVLITNEPPKKILGILKEEGFKEAFLAGGGMINASFLKEKLVDEIYLDVEPVLFGKGIKVVADSDIECELGLLEVKKLNGDTVQLHYKVVK